LSESVFYAIQEVGSRQLLFLPRLIEKGKRFQKPNLKYFCMSAAVFQQNRCSLKQNSGCWD